MSSPWLKQCSDGFLHCLSLLRNHVRLNFGKIHSITLRWWKYHRRLHQFHIQWIYRGRSVVLSPRVVSAYGNGVMMPAGCCRPIMTDNTGKVSCSNLRCHSLSHWLGGRLFLPFKHCLIFYWDSRESHLKETRSNVGEYASWNLYSPRVSSTGIFLLRGRGKTTVAKKHELTRCPKPFFSVTPLVVFLLRGLKLVIFIYYT